MDYCEEIIMNDKFIDGNFISNKHELFSLQIENILYNIENLMITEQQEAYTDSEYLQTTCPDWLLVCFR